MSWVSDRGSVPGAERGLERKRPASQSAAMKETLVGHCAQSLAPLPVLTGAVVLFLNLEGVMLVCFLKTELKEDFELKPTSSAIPSTDKCLNAGSSSFRLAASTR